MSMKDNFIHPDLGDQRDYFHIPERINRTDERIKLVRELILALQEELAQTLEEIMELDK